MVVVSLPPEPHFRTGCSRGRLSVRRCRCPPRPWPKPMAQRPSQAIRRSASQPRSTPAPAGDNFNCPRQLPATPARNFNCPGRLLAASYRKLICPGRLPTAPARKFICRGRLRRPAAVNLNCSRHLSARSFLEFYIHSNWFQNSSEEFSARGECVRRPERLSSRARTRHRDTKERWRAIIGHCALPRRPPPGGDVDVIVRCLDSSTLSKHL